MNKQNVYKALKTFFYLCGFPMLILMLIITLAPMFNVEVMGNNAAVWVISFCAVWLIFEIIRFVLNKFVGSKSEAHHKVILVVTAAIAVFAVLIPTTIAGATDRARYEEARAQLRNPSLVMSYNSVTGWSRDFTEKYDSEVYNFINESYDFMKANGLDHTYSEDYDNADLENGKGHKMGLYEYVDTLVAEKLHAEKMIATLTAELDDIEAKLAAGEVTYEEVEDRLVELKGQRVVIGGELKAAIDNLVDQVIDVVVEALKAGNLDAVLPDGLNIMIGNIEIEAADIVNLLLDKFSGLGGIVEGMITREMVYGLLGDMLGVNLEGDEVVIYTGLGGKTIAYYEGILNDKGGVSLEQAQAMDFKHAFYPVTLSTGMVQFASYICVGIIVLSIFMTDYFGRKEKAAKEGSDNE